MICTNLITISHFRCLKKKSRIFAEHRTLNIALEGRESLLLRDRNKTQKYYLWEEGKLFNVKVVST